MSNSVATSATTPPSVTLLQMMTSYWVSQAIYVAAKLGVADALAGGPLDYTELARATGAHAPSLYRLLRALASADICTEISDGVFGLTPLGALLQSDTPGSMRALAITYNEEMYRAWGDLLHSVRTGEVAFEHHYEMPVFSYFATHPEADAVFNAAMIGWTNQLASAVAGSYDFSLFGTIVDVGGGHGAMLADILRCNPGARGILFDQPRVVDGAEAVLMAVGVAGRCARVGGDFFEAVPAGGDAYILSQILHDWNDEQCITILKRCREVMPAHGKLLVVELVLPPGGEPFIGKWLDLHMLVMTGGRERTAEEYDALFRAAGFALTRVVPTAPGPSVVEAVPV